MTSEVIVMNRMAVALAADSAVTIASGNTSKLRESAVKLFMLSKYHPVGVMVYHNSSLLGVPWETIIKLFRNQLGNKGFDTLCEYGDDLVRYLDCNHSLFSPEVQEVYYLNALRAEYFRIVEDATNELLEKRLYTIADSTKDIAEHQTESIENAIQRRVEFWDSHEDASYYSNVSASEIVGRLSGGISDLVHQVFANWNVEHGSVAKLRILAEQLVSKDHFLPEMFSGLVIAGFGEREHFPVMQHLEVGGVYVDCLKVRPSTSVRVSEQSPSHVLAFAYRDMVQSFISGVSPSVLQHLTDATVFIREMPVTAVDALPNLSAEEKEEASRLIRTASAKKAHEFSTLVFRECNDRIASITNAIDALTISELAQVASTLVSLSSFQQRMSSDRETVGGPVDVAVISKGDGFVWIDRKHYFPRELNYHFYRNYYDHMSNQENAGVPRQRDQTSSDGNEIL